MNGRIMLVTRKMFEIFHATTCVLCKPNGEHAVLK